MTKGDCVPEVGLAGLHDLTLSQLARHSAGKGIRMAKTSKSTGDATVPVIVTTDVELSNNLKSTGSRIADTARRSFQSSAEATRTAATTAGQGMASAAGGMKKAAGATARVAGEFRSAAYLAVGDLNGDGKVDEEDWKIARAAAGRAASGVAREAGELGKAVARHEITKDAAAGAAVGALIAIPVPIIGPIGGAAAGAVVGLTRGVIGSGAIGDFVGQVVSAVRSPPARKPTRRKK